MKVTNTWIFTYEQFKDIKVLADIVQGLDFDGDRDVWLTTNNYPNFHMITLYETGGQFYVKRPYHSSVRSGSGTTYKEALIKATDKQIKEIVELIKEGVI